VLGAVLTTPEVCYPNLDGVVPLYMLYEVTVWIRVVLGPPGKEAGRMN
jgi:Sec-independent protein secretion pathway component TatC